MIEPFSIVAPTASADGYGAAAEALVLAATRSHGAQIQFVEHDWQDSRFTDPDLLDMRVHESAIRDRDVCVVFFLPYGLARYRSRVTLCQTMWESDKLPARWAAILDSPSIGADGVIVPSRQCEQTFGEAISPPVVTVPLGTDTRLYEHYDRSLWPQCIFLMSGLLHYRKGVDIALRAFREEFADGEPVLLWLKTRRGFIDYGSEFAALSDPRVRLIDEDYTRKQMVDLYHSVDCLLAPSRGEGSGLTPRDAMATGLPVILSDWGGLAELADERYCWPIPCGLEPAPSENSSYGRGVTGGGEIGNFASPSIPHLRAAMRDVFENRGLAYERGARASEWMRSDWTWDVCAGKWLAAVERLAAGVPA